MATLTANIFNIQRFSTEDGPGIRTTVFFKGCPLRCPWCANPESQSPFQQLAHRESQCLGCGSCVKACPAGALRFGGGEGESKIIIDRNACNNCGVCIDACPAGAIRFYGKIMTIDEVYNEIKKDVGYYFSSQGGITAGGGEPLLQADFVAELFQRCQKIGIHTTLDTCGYARLSELDKVLKHTNLVLFDLKLMDRVQHKQVIGKSNDVIIRNLRHIVKQGTPVIIRIPLIPGFTDTEENLERAALFISELDRTMHVDLLPYHNYGENKYRMLGMKYQLTGSTTQSKEKLRECKEIFLRHGIDCEVQGESLKDKGLCNKS